jgi:hypothetical protein
MDEHIYRTGVVQQRWQQSTGIAQVEFPARPQMIRHQPSGTRRRCWQIGAWKVNAHKLSVAVAP